MPKTTKTVIRTYDGPISQVTQCEIALEMARQGYYLMWAQGKTLYFYPLEDC